MDFFRVTAFQIDLCTNIMNLNWWNKNDSATTVKCYYSQIRGRGGGNLKLPRMGKLFEIWQFSIVWVFLYNLYEFYATIYRF